MRCVEVKEGGRELIYMVGQDRLALEDTRRIREGGDIVFTLFCRSMLAPRSISRDTISK